MHLFTLCKGGFYSSLLLALMLHLWSSAKVVHASRKISSHTAATTGSSSASSKGHVMIARCLHDLCVAHVCGAPLSTTDIVTLAITHTQVIQRKMSMAPKCSHNWLWGAVWTSCSMDWGSVFRPHLAVLFILDKQQHLRGAHRATAWRGVSCRGLHKLCRLVLEVRHHSAHYPTSLAWRLQGGALHLQLLLRRTRNIALPTRETAYTRYGYS